MKSFLDKHEKRVRVGDLVALGYHPGFWTPQEEGRKSKWVNLPEKRFYYATVDEIRDHGDVPHSGEPEACIKVVWWQEDTSEPYPTWYWVTPQKLILISRASRLRKILS